MPSDAGPDARRVLAFWTDVDGRQWQIESAPGNLVARSGSDVVSLPEDSWTQDIYIAEHGQGFIIRFETFDHVLRFVVPREAALPVLIHLHRAVTRAAQPAEPEPADTPSRPLLWPKVSPLAVWALILSALVFLPIVGLIAAAGTITLLLLHRLKVRRAAAWHHSRNLCRAATVLLVVGLLVSGLSTWGLVTDGWGSNDSVWGHASSTEGRNWGAIAAGIFVVLFSLSLHEAAHAASAWWLGDGLARSMGRVTLNPLAHIDPFGTILLPAILAWAGAPVFGYARPVPVRVESLPRRRRAHILISLAGPGSNLLLAAVSLMVLLATGCVLRLAAPEAVVTNFAGLDFSVPIEVSGFALAPIFGPALTILKLSFLINVFLAMFNLIPIPPLDGSWVLEHLFPSSLGRLYAVIRPYGFLIFVAALYTGLIEYLVIPVLVVLLPALLLLAGATGYN
jgi:Zn-dependent protease